MNDSRTRRPRPAAPDLPLRVGVSACLLGHNVRYDGGHKRDAFLLDGFGRHVEWVPVCPEVEMGMGTPREPIRLETRGDVVHLVAPKSGTDHTAAMRRFADTRVRALAAESLSGYIFKKDSPSCGVFRVRVHNENGLVTRTGRGAFADVLIEHFPGLPVEEEGRLGDPILRESFVERVFAYARLRALFTGRWTVGGLVAFHTAQKLLLMAHSPSAYASIGRLVARAKDVARADLRERYSKDVMEALAVPATRGRHVNVLQHAYGYFSERLTADEREEMATLIDDYRRGLLPLVVPITLLRHYVRRFDVGYLNGQVYLEPHPKELMLRNHV